MTADGFVLYLPPLPNGTARFLDLILMGSEAGVLGERGRGANLRLQLKTPECPYFCSHLCTCSLLLNCSKVLHIYL